MPPNPSMEVLNTGIENFPSDFCTLVTHILLVARFLIKKYWKTDKTPNISEVLEITQTRYVYESFLASKCGTSKKFDINWKLWKEQFKVN